MAANGNTIDRNLIIITFYNMAVYFQRYSTPHSRLGNNADCIKYLDASLHNLKHKSINIDLGDETRDRGGRRLRQKLALASRMTKLRFQSKLHLQMCAMLSQVDEQAF